MDLSDVLMDRDREFGAALAGLADMRRDEVDRLSGQEKLANVLTAKGRDQVKEKNFAIPKEDAYPIHDLAHARNALSRVSTNGTPEEKAKVRSAVAAKYPELAERASSIPEKDKEKTSGIERITEVWNKLPQEAKAAIIGAPIGAGIAGAGQYMSSKPMMGGDSSEEVVTQTLRDKLQRMNEGRGGGGFAGQTAEGLAESSVQQAGINKEHPLKAALVAALIGAGGGAGTGAALARLR
jgi:hypothetical protein